MAKEQHPTVSHNAKSGCAESMKIFKSSSAFLYVFSFITISFSSGLVYGYPQLRDNLMKYGRSTLSEKELGLVYTIGSWSAQGSRFFTGIARDKYGTRYVAIMCLVFVLSGCLGIAFSDENDIIALGMSFFLVGLGSGSQLCVQPVTYLFDEQWQGTIMSSFSGAFQISGLMFLIITKITSNRLKGFIGYGFVIILLIFSTYFILPKKSFTRKAVVSYSEGKVENMEGPSKLGNDEEKLKEVSEISASEDKYNSGASDGRRENIHSDHEEKDKIETDGASSDHFEHDLLTKVEEGGIERSSKELETITNVLKTENNDNRVSGDDLNSLSDTEKKGDTLLPESSKNDEVKVTAMNQIRSLEYCHLVLWFSIQIIPLQYYIGTIGLQLERKGDVEGTYVNLFSIIYASSSILGPAFGIIADRFGLGVGQFVASTFSGISFFILSSTNLSLNMHVIGMVAYGVGRLSTYGMFFTNVGKRFGFSNYGTLAGLGLLLSAIVSLLQFPLIALAANGSEQIVNIVCGVFIICTAAPYCFWLRRKEKGN